MESYENYQDYLAVYDPADAVKNLSDQEAQQQRFADLVDTVLPLINQERRQLINLCLKYGFRYKDIAQVMGKSTKEIIDDVKRAINDIKKIVNGQMLFERKQQKVEPEAKQIPLSEIQEQVLRMRCEMNLSFAAIAQELHLSQKEVHEEFMVAYKFSQQQLYSL